MMRESTVLERLVQAVAKESGVERSEVEKVLAAVGIERLAEKIADLHRSLAGERGKDFGQLGESVAVFTDALQADRLDVANLRLQYRIHDLPLGDGFSQSVAA